MSAAAPFFSASADFARQAGEMLLAELQRSDADISAAKLLNMLGTNVDYTLTTENGETALLLAAQKGFFTAAGRMTDFGADVNKADKFGFTPLMMAASGNDRALVDALLAKNADLNARSAAGDTAFTLAGGQGHAGMLKYLIEKGAAFTDAEGIRTITEAAAHGHTAVVQTINGFLDARVEARTRAAAEAVRMEREKMATIADTFRHGSQAQVVAPRTARFKR